MSTSRKSSISALRVATAEGRRLLSAFPVSVQHYYTDHALAGYLWHALSTVDTLLVALESPFAGGAEPLKRYLHECYLDVAFLASDPDPELHAAMAFLSEYEDSQRLVNDYRKVEAAYPDHQFPALPEASNAYLAPLADLVVRLDAANAACGRSPDLFARAAKAREKQKHWHWSGLSRKKMVEVLVARGRFTINDQLMSDSLTKLYNGAAHAAPAWGQLPFPATPQAAIEIDPPGEASERSVTQLAIGAEQFLSGVIRTVVDYHSTRAA